MQVVGYPCNSRLSGLLVPFYNYLPFHSNYNNFSFHSKVVILKAFFWPLFHYFGYLLWGTFSKSVAVLLFFFQMENSVSVSGGYMGSKASLKVDMKKFKESMSDKTEFGEHKVSFTSGGVDMPEPIGIRIVPIYEAFDVSFYAKLDHQNSARCVHSSELVGTRREHVKKALEEYPKLKKAEVPTGKKLR